MFKPSTTLQLIEHNKKNSGLSDDQDVIFFFFSVTAAGKLSPT